MLLSNYKKESKKALDKRGISFYGRETLTYFIKSGGIEISNWSHPTPMIDLSTASCRYDGSLNVEDKQFVHCMNNQTFMYEYAANNVMAISLEYKQNTNPISLMFSALDHKLKFQNPSDELHSRMQLNILLLRKMDCMKSIPTIKMFLSHQQHYIRWYAMQQLLGLDAFQVLDELNDMALNDPNSEVRFAAEKTLEIVKIKELAHAS